MEYGLFLKVIICDQGLNNMKIRKLFGVTVDNLILLIIIKYIF